MRNDPTYFKIQLIIIPLLLIFFSYKANAQSDCSNITYKVVNYEPCKFRINITNNSECYPDFKLVLDSGEFTNWKADNLKGWTGQLLSPTELLLTHSSGIIPLGSSSPVEFTLSQDVNPKLSFLWDYACPPGIGCFFETPLVGCTDPSDAGISGTVYRECSQLQYFNQATLSDREITLLDETGNVLSTALTDLDGAYDFPNLMAGSYKVKEKPKPGWTPKVPASGQYDITLKMSEQAVLDFSNCPQCTCDSIYMDIVALPIESADTCSYQILAQNSGVFCFSKIDLTLTSGTLAGWKVSQTGWNATQIDAQHLTILPANGYVPEGLNYPVQISVTGSANQVFQLKTSWDKDANIENCERAFSFNCPKPPDLSCCPAGNFQGPNMVINGDFEAGNTGFTNGFNYFTPGGHTQIGSYSVLQGTQVYAANTQWACIDHTNTSPTNKFLVIDGNKPQTNNIAWKNLVNVYKGQQYAFCAFVNNLVSPLRNYDDPVVELWINGIKLASITLKETPDAWYPLKAVWAANISGIVPIEIRLGSPLPIGNDVAIDDISFRFCSTIPPCDPSTVGLTGSFPFQSNANDASPTGKDGIIHSATNVSGQDGAPNSAYHFNGVSNWIDCGTDNRSIINSVTVCAWVKTFEKNKGQWVVGKYSFTEDKGYTLSIGNGANSNIGQVSFSGRDGTNPGGIGHSSGWSDTLVNDNKWHCIIGKADNDFWSVYVDGKLDKTMAGTTSGGIAPSTSVPLTIGYQNPSSPVWMNGDIDNVMIYNRALTQEEIDCYCVSAAPKDTCKCGVYSDMWYRPIQGAPNIPTKCGASLTAKCNNLIPWTLGGSFSCQGNSCPDTTLMSWTLTKPIGIASGTMIGNPNFTISIPATEFNSSGTYVLLLKAVCGKDTCYCEYSIVVECETCCKGHDAFIAAAMNVQTNGILGDCMAHFDATGLDSCMQISYTWGDNPSVIDGPYGNNTPVWHTYSGSGTYNVCYLIQEVNSNDSICWTYEHCENVTVLCNSCLCDSTFYNSVNKCFNNIKNSSLNYSFTPVDLLDNCDSVLWAFGDNNTSTAVGNQTVSHSYASAGTYLVCMFVTRTDANGNICKYECCQFDSITTAVNEPIDINGFIAKPNPTFNIVNIELSDKYIDPKNVLNITSLNGKILMNVKVNAKNTNLNMESMPSGLYILTLTDKDGFLLSKPQKLVKLN